METKPLEICGRLHDPGAATDIPKYVDYAARESTPDQRRIADVLETRVGPACNILHVGIGNSALARKFAGRVNHVDGLTVNENEARYGRGLGLANYRVLRLSKHAGEFPAHIGHKYHFIVDNNLGTFSCCRYHFYVMFDNYLWALAEDGLILTDEVGLGWACADPAFLLDHAALVTLEDRLPIKVSRLTETVIAIERNRHLPPRSPLTVSYRLCRRNGSNVVEERPV